MKAEQTDLHRRTAEFVQLLKQHDRRVSAYVYSLVLDWNDAEDIVQETSVRLWEQFDEYRVDEDFGAWACTIARYMVMAYRKRAQRDRLQFSQDVVEAIGTEFDSASEESDRRLRALAECVGKLNDSARDLLQHCYYDGKKIKEVAEQLGRSLNGTYLALSRIRRTLHDCIETTLRREEIL